MLQAQRAAIITKQLGEMSEKIRKIQEEYADEWKDKYYKQDYKL